MIKLKDEEQETKKQEGGTHTVFAVPVTTVNAYKLFIGDMENNDENLDEIFFKLEESTVNDTLEVSIHSCGGYLTELQRFENVMKNQFYGRVTTFLNPFGYSAAALLFCLGDQRVCFENSQIMFHDFSAGYYGKSSDMKNQMEFDMVFVKNHFNSIIDKFFSKQELEMFYKGHEFWFDALEMCKRGICTHVVKNGAFIDAKDYLASKTPKTSKKVKG